MNASKRTKRTDSNGYLTFDVAKRIDDLEYRRERLYASILRIDDTIHALSICPHGVNLAHGSNCLNCAGNDDRETITEAPLGVTRALDEINDHLESLG